MDCSLPGSSVHGIFQAIVVEWITISFSRGSSQPRDRTQVSRIVDRHFTIWATREVSVESSKTKSKKNFNFLSCEMRLGWEWPQWPRKGTELTHRGNAQALDPYNLRTEPWVLYLIIFLMGQSPFGNGVLASVTYMKYENIPLSSVHVIMTSPIGENSIQCNSFEWMSSPAIRIKAFL